MIEKITLPNGVRILYEQVPSAVSYTHLSPENREFLIRRVREVAESIAKAFRATIRVEEPTGGTPPSYNNPALCEEMLPFIKEIVPEDKVFVRENQPSLGSEDFAYVSTKVPSMMINLGAGSTEEEMCIRDRCRSCRSSWAPD